jgi:hypothetical protein
MTTTLKPIEWEFKSGEVVEPGCYMDVETGAIVQVYEADELPDGSRVVRYHRRFRRVENPLPSKNN